MQVLFSSRDPEALAMRDVAVRRALFVMRRMTWLVPRAKVQLTDINGPRGGIDKRCQVELKTERGTTVVVTAMAHDWRTALETALSRAARTLLRSWRREGGSIRPNRRPDAAAA
jgi:hypothetical protein